MTDDTEGIRDEGRGVGAEGGDNENADRLPPLPSNDDDTPLGDTDQHSEATPGEHDQMRQ
ncbi:MAG TPA: hypothetical protein VIL49_04465 [Capillimicrobium sp.]|jgi:hypothetical protein